MLSNLNVRNYALIRNLDLEFGPGLTIVTGETGAGKSIMLGALSLVLGGRADTRMISDDGSKSVVEAVFTDIDSELRPILEERGIEWVVAQNGAPELTVRREISSSGRSRILVNDSSVTLQTLALITPRLIDIHSQHANAKINDPGERLLILDAMAGNTVLHSEYEAVFHRYVDLRRRIKVLREGAARSAENAGFIRFRLETLSKLNPQKGELESLEKRFAILSDADEIKEKTALLAKLLGDGVAGVQSLLAEAASVSEKMDLSALLGPDESDSGPDMLQRIKQMQVEARDICESLYRLDARVDTDPASLARISARIDLYYDAMKRFQVENADNLCDIRLRLQDELHDLEHGDSSLPELERQARQLGQELKLKADALSNSRRECADVFSKRLCEIASQLGLPNVRFEARVNQRKFSASGQDEVEFLCSFNKNGMLRPIGQIASGGEVARMMLSLKSLLAGHINLPTIIFDEVDTGVSGEIADKMGKMMHDISNNMQVIAITHLPQVAAKGDSHLKVYKKDAETRTETHVAPLSDEERVKEIAAMISGSNITDAALEAARHLITNA